MSNAVEIVRRCYDALRRSDVPGFVALMPPDIEGTEAERFPYHAGTWQTPQAVVEQLLLPLRRDWSSFSTTPTDYLTDGERVVRVWCLFRNVPSDGQVVQRSVCPSVDGYQPFQTRTGANAPQRTPRKLALLTSPPLGPLWPLVGSNFLGNSWVKCRRERLPGSKTRVRIPMGFAVRRVPGGAVQKGLAMAA